MDALRNCFTRFGVYLILVLLLGCNLPANRPVTPTAFLPTPTWVPSPSPVPTVLLRPATFPPAVQPSLTAAPMILASNTPNAIPCNRAEFVGDQTIPDGTQITAGASFTKVWRIRNAGSCSWTAAYGLLFDHGERMEAPLSQPLTPGTVPSGATMDLAVTLRAPVQPGAYQASFRLRSPDNTLFGIGAGQGTFWVKIVVPPPTRAPTDTPLPPDFDQLVNYGGGGGGGSCGLLNPEVLPSFDIVQSTKFLEVCIWGATFGPLANLEFTSPDGRKIQPVLLQIDEQTKQIAWSSYPTRDYFFPASGNGTKTFTKVELRIPANFPHGNWQISASGGFQATGSFSIGPESNSPAVTAVNRDRGDEFLPGMLLPGHHLLMLNKNGRLDVTGSGFPAGIPAYVLLYRQAFPEQYLLETVQTVRTDASGSLTAELAGPFTTGQTYLILGITDPHARIADENGGLDETLPRDLFIVVSP